ncbi:MAG: hypothetical protein L0Y55_14645, partial [Anaerolineales bacterium]|nr:hypothetical protein [Anaerolineales bacterium]
MNTLERLLVAQRAQFDALAAVWLQADATGFGVSHNGRDLMSWTREPHRGAPRTRAPIANTSCIAGELWLEGLPNPAARARLEMDAALVSHWLALEAELDTMTADLIDAQDQLLALYDLNKALGKFLKLEDLFAALAREAARLLKCGCAFVCLQMPDGRVHCAQTPDTALNELQVRGLFECVVCEG